jgi:dipeptidyl aminopeptidase/acylaminoacyl peptidase
VAYVSRGQQGSAVWVNDLSLGRSHLWRRGWFGPWIGWAAGGAGVYVSSSGPDIQRGNTGIYAVSSVGRVSRVSPVSTKIDDCDDLYATLVACVVQSASQPPQPGLIDLRTREVRRLADVNPELRNIALGPVSELHWTNGYGHETNGYLVLPPSVGERHNLPLVLMAYGYDGDFVSHASSVDTSYPAQLLAQAGIGVLLFNYPHSGDPENFEATKFEYGANSLSSLQRIITELATEGVIDLNRIGYAGHSLGGFFVQYTLENTSLIRAAELHNGGTNVDPEDYTLVGNSIWQKVGDRMMGGPPWGKSLANYVALSAALNAYKIRTPIMMEYSDEIRQLQFFGALRHAGSPVELYIYPNDMHIFQNPNHVYSSLVRNVDWFRFWLQGYEDPDSSKVEQYARWEKLCDLQRAGNPDQSAFCAESKP